MMVDTSKTDARSKGNETFQTSQDEGLPWDPARFRLQSSGQTANHPIQKMVVVYICLHLPILAWHLYRATPASEDKSLDLLAVRRSFARTYLT